MNIFHRFYDQGILPGEIEDSGQPAAAQENPENPVEDALHSLQATTTFEEEDETGNNRTNGGTSNEDMDHESDDEDEEDEEDEDYVPEEEDRNLQLLDLGVENAKLIPTKWREGWSKSPEIGGVHLGKVPLKMELSPPGNGRPFLHLSSMRNGNVIQSGQVYIPFFKRGIQKPTISKFKDIGLLPSMVSNILLPKAIFSRTLKVNKSKLVSILKHINHTKTTLEQEVNQNKGNNSVRLEFFFKSTFSSEDADWTIPDVDPLSFILVAPKNSYFQTYLACIKDVVDPLIKTFVHNRELEDYDSLSPAAKRMLILCSELAVEMTEFFPFSGKGVEAIKKLWGTDAHPFHGAGEQHLFMVPPTLLEELRDMDKRQTGLKVGLNNVLYQIPLFSDVDTVGHLSAEDIKRRKEDYIQFYQNSSLTGVTLANIFMSAVGNILGLLWSQINTTEEPRRNSMYQIPPRDTLHNLNDTSKEWFLKQACRVISNSYDLEWWWHVRGKLHMYKIKKKNPTINPKGPPEEFPTTQRGFEDYENKNKLVVKLGVKDEDIKTVDSLGKLTFFTN